MDYESTLDQLSDYWVGQNVAFQCILHGPYVLVPSELHMQVGG